MDCYDFKVLAEDRDWLVIDKPAPLIVHPTSTKPEPTLWHGLQELLRFEIVNGGQVSLVNRLDRETSGATLVAKSFRGARLLGKAMMRHQIGKEYLAIVHGHPGWAEATCREPLLRMGKVMPSEVFVRQCAHPEGKPARTDFRVESMWENSLGRFSLVRCFPRTGRMHQIRVHLAHVGFPILGDKIYAGDPTCFLDNMETGWTPELARRLLFPRHALHAAVISFPYQMVHHCVTAPLADDMARWITQRS